MIVTFKGGIHPNEQKEHTENVPIEFLLPLVKSEMVYPLQQHLGAPCQPIVEVGQHVKLGEKIADTDAFISAPIHSGVSGVVKDICPHLTVVGTIVNSIIIENDGKLEEHESLKPREGIDKLSREDILKIIREAGIVGQGGAGFPTHAKLALAPDKNVDTIIVNGSECEPFLTTDNRIMIEEADKIVTGLHFMMKVLPDTKGFIAIEENKPDAIEAVRTALEHNPGPTLMITRAKYPQGAEKQLVNAVTKREVPSGGIPIDAGCLVHNVDTVIAIHRAIFRGRPLMRKVVTVSGGAIRKPGNFKVRLGTKLSDLVEMIGGFQYSPAKVVAGGPMMGVAIFDINVPIVKTTGGVVFLTDAEAHIPQEENCMRCGKCVEHCPVGLIPTELNADILRENSEMFIMHNGIDCIECGSCSYICPAKRRLSQAIRTTRRVEIAKRKK